MAWIKVAKITEMRDGEARVVEANGTQVALFKVGGNFYATDNTCIHRGGPLGQGSLSGEVVTCPWHGWQYNVKTGVNVSGMQGVKAFKVKIEGENVLVEV